MLRQLRLGLALLFCGTSLAGKCVNPTALEHEISNFETNYKYNSAATNKTDVCFSPSTSNFGDKDPNYGCSIMYGSNDYDYITDGELVVNFDSCKLCDPANPTYGGFLRVDCTACITGEQVSKNFVVPANTVVVVDRIMHWLENAYTRSGCSSVFLMSAASSPLLKMSSLNLGASDDPSQYMMFNGPFVLLEGATLSATTSFRLYDSWDRSTSFPGSIDDYNQSRTRTACTTRVEVIARSYDLTDYMNGDVCY